MASRQLHFDVSTGLKTVLGSELITDDEVAIFELVKNSYDANATHVDIVFDDDIISVVDNGDGMSIDDIKNKWLLVAYSSKREARKKKNFRQEIADRKHYAGSKGIGRFSSDRLGCKVILQTKHKNDLKGHVHQVIVDWQQFDHDPKKLFNSVGVDYVEKDNFDCPISTKRLTHGTIIKVEQTRQNWNRERIIQLKSAMAKMINPFGSSSDGFKITIIAPAEKIADAEITKQRKTKGQELTPRDLVNGEVGNFVFDELKLKTTFIDVGISLDGKYIESSLTDRGEIIYRIREPNPYTHLQITPLNCQIYFLNSSAKNTFTRRMGVPSVEFGSIFLFRNGFRVYPIGEEGDDWFKLDRRKQQGFARFLGTRDVIGRIQVTDEHGIFEEASSRNQGLIENDAVEEIKKFFKEHCLKRLEKYIVPVTFVDKEDRNTEDLSRLLTDPGRARVAEVVAKLVDNEGVELLDYSKQLIRILNTRSEQFEPSLASFRAIAEHTKDTKLFKKIEEAEDAFAKLRKSEEAARKQADQERTAKVAAQIRAEKAEKAAIDAGEQLEEEKKRNLFLASIASLDTEKILSLHHQITIYAVSLNVQIENFLVKINNQKNVATSEVVSALEPISLLNRKVMGIAKFATKANFRLETEKIRADLAEYVEQYVNGVAKLFEKISLKVESDGKGFVQSFKPIDVSVVVDNLIANAKKAKATKVKFQISHPTRETVHIRVIDNGKGLDQKVKNPSRIFEKGFTTTDGSGLGLYHVQQVLGEMKGTIEVENHDTNGVTLLIRISK